MTEKLKILFLCTGNSCRSQMAEGWCRHLKSDLIEAFSAGIETHGLNPNAVKVMAEAGVDISGQKSKLLSEFNDIEFDYVVTVCGHANEHCPVFIGTTKKIHVGFDDPPKLAETVIGEKDKLDCYRKVRDQIKSFIEKDIMIMLNKNAEIKKEVQKESVCCGEGCSCNTVSSKTKTIKIVVSLIVLLAIAGILIYKFSIKQQNKSMNAAKNSTSTFSLKQSTENSKTEVQSNSALEINEYKESAINETMPKQGNSLTSKSEQNSEKIGNYIGSLSELSKVASNKDAVFIFIPEPKSELADAQTKSAVNAAQKSLKSNDISLGLYTLRPISQEYLMISKQIQPPAILVASKGRGMVAVTGDVNKTKLLQAFMAASRAGGCGSSSACGPSNIGCN